MEKDAARPFPRHPDQINAKRYHKTCNSRPCCPCYALMAKKNQHDIKNNIRKISHNGKSYAHKERRCHNSLKAGKRRLLLPLRKLFGKADRTAHTESMHDQVDDHKNRKRQTDRRQSGDSHPVTDHDGVRHVAERQTHR